MSRSSWDSLYPATRKSIAAQPLRTEQSDDGDRACGCQRRRGERWWLCQYHVGFEDGVDAAMRGHE